MKRHPGRPHIKYCCNNSIDNSLIIFTNLLLILSASDKSFERNARCNSCDSFDCRLLKYFIFALLLFGLFTKSGFMLNDIRDDDDEIDIIAVILFYICR